MKQSSYKGRSPLPDAVIDAACAGDATAIDHILRHYDKYINKLCTRTLYEKDGSSCVRVDEVMKSRLQAKLVKALVEKK